MPQGLLAGWEEQHFKRKALNQFVEDSERHGWDFRTMIMESAKRGLAQDPNVQQFIKSHAGRESQQAGRASAASAGLERPVSAMDRGGVPTRSVQEQLSEISAKGQAKQPGVGIMEPKAGEGMGGGPGGGGVDVWAQGKEFQPGVSYGLRDPSQPTIYSPEAQGASTMATDPSNPLNRLETYANVEMPQDQRGREAAATIRTKWEMGYYGEGEAAFKKAIDDAEKQYNEFVKVEREAKAAGLDRVSKEKAARQPRAATAKRPIDDYFTMQDNVRDIDARITAVRSKLFDPKVQIIDVEGMQLTRAQANAQLKRLEATAKQYDIELAELRQRAGLPAIPRAAPGPTGAPSDELKSFWKK